ncbi:hypothetical protein BH09GEM1_BH09GEM1_32920 [soil metagenome]
MTELSTADQQVLDALRRAVAKALDRKRRLGQYAVIWRDGKVVRLEADELPLIDESVHPKSDG